MTAPIALQLYSVREEAARDFFGVVEKVAAIGYAGVETAHLPEGVSATAAGDHFRQLGLTVTSAHLPLPLGENKQPVLEMAAAFGCNRLVCPALDTSIYFQSLESVERAAALLNEANAVATEHGLSLGVHNHWWEFERVNGRYPYRVWQEQLDPAIFFELDVYWIQAARFDPAPLVGEFGPRAPLLHIKDGPATRGAPMVAVGDGVLDMPAIVAASAGNADWLIVELDECETDMLTALSRSYQYMIREGLAHGR